MTLQEFQDALTAAQTMLEAKAIVDAFVPEFTKLTNGEKGKYRAIWKKRKVELGGDEHSLT